MKKVITREQKFKQELLKAQRKLNALEREMEEKKEELEKFCKRHRSVNLDGLETCDLSKLKQIYAYLDKTFPIDVECGLRYDDSGMALTFWVDNDPDYLIIHLHSTCENIIFSGSTSYLAKAVTLEDKVNLIKQIKADVSKILK